MQRVPQPRRWNAFFKGTSSFWIQNLKAHDSSKVHESCSKAKAAKENPAKAPMNLAIRNMESATLEKMIKLFNIAYFAAKEETPFAKFPKLCTLHEKNNVELGHTYFNDHACRVFTESIADVMKHELSSKLRAGRFFSVLCDCSTDSAILEQELVYVRYLEGGLLVSQFL